MNRNSIIALAIALVMAMAFAACRSGKGTGGTGVTPGAAKVASRQSQEASAAGTGSASRTIIHDYAAMTAAYRPWSDLTVPVKVSVTAPKKVSLSGTLTMAYGRSMSLSLKMLFIEAASVYADTDSVIIISRPAGVYYAESLKGFTAASGLGLSDLQALMLGQMFAPGKGTATDADRKLFSMEPLTDIVTPGIYAWTMTPTGLSEGVDWHFTALAPEDAAAATPQLFALDIAIGPNNLQCTFAQAESSEAGPVAAKMQIEGVVKKHALDLIVASTPSKMRWNSGALPRKPSLPSGARRLTSEQLMKILGNI